MMRFPAMLRPVPLLAVLALGGCTAGDILSVIGSTDLSRIVGSLAGDEGAKAVAEATALIADTKRVRAQFEKLLGLLRDEVARRWGEDEVVVPGKRRYVKYTQNYQSRAVVDFDRGLVTVETLDSNPASLRNAIVTTLLTPDDPRAVDLYSDRPIELSGTPYLEGLVRDHQGRLIETQAQAEAFAFHLARRARVERVVRTPEGSQVAHAVEFSMVSDHLEKRAARYEPHVDRFSNHFGVSKSLVFAVIKTESDFNPFAVSGAPAYGLMQLVPTTGGRDAYRMVNGTDAIPNRDYLFDAENNIELGTAYLNLLDRRYLAAIEDPTSREYCTIAAYNGGAGALLEMFDPDRDRAVAEINALSPAAVYRALRERHPRDETRRYLAKVLDARKRFVNL